VKYGDSGAYGGTSHHGKVPVLHPLVIFNGDRNDGKEVLVLMVFLALKGRCSIEMERVAGRGRQTCSLLNKQLIGAAKVLNKNKWKFVLLQNLFS
jgi:hypothetical protein